jgi:hypothetical protein
MIWSYTAHVSYTAPLINDIDLTMILQNILPAGWQATSSPVAYTTNILSGPNNIIDRFSS